MPLRDVSTANLETIVGELGQRLEIPEPPKPDSLPASRMESPRRKRS